MAPSSSALINECLDDPYSTIAAAHLGFGGSLGHYLLNDFQVERVYLGKARLVDIDGDNRADLFIPVLLRRPFVSKPQTALLVFNNRPVESSSQLLARTIVISDDGTLLAESTSFVPSEKWEKIQDLNDVDDVEQVSLKGDLNGDGLLDELVLKKPPWYPEADDSPARFRRSTAVASARINIGPRLVREEDLRQGVLDLRLGFMAGFAQSYSQGWRALRGSDGPAVQEFNKFVRFSNALVERIETNPLNGGFVERTGTTVQPPSAGDIDDTLRNLEEGSLERAFISYPEIDFGVLYRDVYIPDSSLYALGFSQGVSRSAKEIQFFQMIQQKVPALSEALTSLQREDIPGPGHDAVVTNVASVSNDVANSLQLTGVSEIGASLFLPRRIDVEKTGDIKVSVESVVSSLKTKMVPPSTAPLNLLDSHWLLRRPEESAGILNAPRVVGSALAVFSLSLLRGDPGYVSAISHKGSAGDIAASANTMIANLGAPLSKLFADPGFLQEPGAAYVAAASSSGYGDLARFVANDIQAAAFWAGVDQAHREDLKAIKDSLSSVVPDLRGALDIHSALDVIGTFINQQQSEIGRLHGVIDDLQKIVVNLNNLLESANSTIKKLSQDLGNTLGHIGKTADATTRLLNAGTGSLIGGPIGAIACIIWC